MTRKHLISTVAVAIALLSVPSGLQAPVRKLAGTSASQAAAEFNIQLYQKNQADRAAEAQRLANERLAEASAKATYRYIKLTPIEVNSEMSKPIKGIYYTKLFITAFQETAVIYWATHNWALASAPIPLGLAVTLPKTTFDAWLDHTMYLGYKVREQVSQVIDLPGLKGIQVISAKDFEYDNFIAAKGRMKGVMLVETQGEIPAAELEKWHGDLVPLADFPDAKVTLSFHYWGNDYAKKWEIPGTQLHEGIAMPDDILADWRKYYDHAVDSGGGPMSVVAEIQLAPDKVVKLGPLFEGPLVAKFFLRDMKSRITHPLISFAKEAIGMRRTVVGWNPSSYPKAFLEKEAWVREKIIQPIETRVKRTYENGKARLKSLPALIP